MTSREEVTSIARNACMPSHHRIPLLDYAARESLKEEGAKALNDSALPIKDRADGAVKIIKAHYIRSVEAYFDKPVNLNNYSHPDFEVYASHYVSAHLNSISFARVFEAEIVTELIRRFSHHGPANMRPGSSYWGY